MTHILDFQALLLFHLRNNVHPRLPAPDTWLDTAIEAIAAARENEWDKKMQHIALFPSASPSTVRQVMDRLNLMPFIEEVEMEEG